MHVEANTNGDAIGINPFKPTVRTSNEVSFELAACLFLKSINVRLYINHFLVKQRFAEISII